MKRIFTKEEREDMIARYKNGESPKSIATIHKCAAGSVLKVMRANNIPRNQLSKMSDKDIKFCISEYEKGTNSEMIAQKLGRTGATICKVLKKNGIKIRSGPENKRKLNLNVDYFEKIDTEEKAYFLGLMYADGHVHSSRQTVSLTSKNEDILIAFSQAIYGDNKVKKYAHHVTHSGKVTEYAYLSIYSSKFHQDLCNLGCTPDKNLTIRLPDFLKENTLLPHFIRGYIDGGDSLITQRDVFELTEEEQFDSEINIEINGNSNFISDLDCVFKSKNIIGQVEEYANKKNMSRLVINARNNVNLFFKFIYNGKNPLSGIEEFSIKYIDSKNNEELNKLFKKKVELRHELASERARQFLFEMKEYVELDFDPETVFNPIEKAEELGWIH